LARKAEVALGDAIICSGCSAVFNKTSHLEQVGEEQIWTCEFCNEKNSVVVEKEEMPTSAEVTYLIESSA
jgi:hypothetical protein